MKTPPLPENSIQNAVKFTFENRGWKVIQTHDSFRRPMHDGITDLICVKHGFVAWVECKCEGWKPAGPEAKVSKTERAQREFETDLVAHGGCYVRISSIEEIGPDVTRLDYKAEQLREWKAGRKRMREV